VTVSVGRDALLACVVDNLRNYKVSGTRARFFCSHIYRRRIADQISDRHIGYQISRDPDQDSRSRSSSAEIVRKN